METETASRLKLIAAGSYCTCKKDTVQILFTVKLRNIWSLLFLFHCKRWQNVPSPERSAACVH